MCIRRVHLKPVTSWRMTFILVIAVLEILNASYLAAFDTASIFYHANVLLHVVLGLPLALAILFRSIPALLKGASRSGGIQAALLRALALLAGLFVLSGLVLCVTGTARPYLPILRLHVVSAIAGGALLLAIAWLWSRRAGADRKSRAVFRWNAGVLGAALLFPIAIHAWRTIDPPHVVRIVNPPSPPATPFEEGAGATSPFFPSSNELVGTDLMPSDFFLDSQRACGNKGCHPDITTQWESSMHHFSSFNNQWYRKSIEYMQDVVGTKPSKWCGGCHDMAVLLTGRMDQPIREQIDTPQSQAGIGCLVCHSIVDVKGTMGQGSFVLEYPAMHRLASSPSPAMKLMHDYMVRLDPAPHRATMLKPFHRQSTPEFCSSCHKVHLDVPVNSYRWFRGFNEYDAWQQSGVSGEGARAFYDPPEPKKCAACHMPLVASNDAGNIGGQVHSHRFPGANTAIPFVNGDHEQLEITTRFLKENSVTVDIFAVAAREAPSRMTDGAGAPAAASGDHEETLMASTMFAGEEGVLGESAGGSAPRGELIAPLPAQPDGETGVTLQRGRSYLMEVVTRTRNVGHMFPGGTVDAFDVWVELEGRDAQGGVVFWNGWVEQEPGGRKGPVDPGAHFYRSLQLDGRGNRINKRNAWSTRALLYARLVPPGAAETAHFAVRIPEDCGDKVTFTARVNYRKFAWWNTQWAYAGVRRPFDQAAGLSAHYDDGQWDFTGDTSTVSGKLKEIPDLPIIEVASSTRSFAVSGEDAAEANRTVLDGQDRLLARGRYNDYGIGLLLQRDFKGALAAFTQVTQLDPNYADGFVNIGRAQLDEGNHTAARATLEKALELAPGLPRAHYFYALSLKSTGRYDEAIEHLRTTLEAYPRDRVVLNQLGRILFLQRRYDEAIGTFRRVLAVDPEDLQAHYNLMLCHRGRGDTEAARREEALYARFKADESSQEITGAVRRAHPDDNRERQLIHEHPNTWPGAARGMSSRGYQGQ